jgi:hypothetical protein
MLSSKLKLRFFLNNFLSLFFKEFTERFILIIFKIAWVVKVILFKEKRKENKDS